ncbi:MAG: cell division protein FtsA [Desulfovibrio sp.]|jgi:cell division protein FtsA|nr:cell division protein FtsA [Desulfovibrio sp.]
MAKANNLVIGLDIGTTKICAVVGEISETGADVVGVGACPSTGLRDGVVVNIDSTAKSIKRAVEEAELMAGCSIRSVYAGIAGSHIKGFNSDGVVAIAVKGGEAGQIGMKGGEVGQGDVDRVLEHAGAVAIPADREVIHTLPQEFSVDNQDGIRDPLGMTGVRLAVKVHIVTGAVSSVQNVIAACHRSDLGVVEVVLESLASAKAVLTNEERELGVALVDIGGGTTDIAIFTNDTIKHTGVIGIGGQKLTNDIYIGLRTPMNSAEEIKTRYGCALVDLVSPDEVIAVPSVGGREPRRLSRRLLAEICQPRLEDILDRVEQGLTKSGCKHLIGAGVVLTGGTALLDGCQELAEQIFNLPTRIGYPRNVGGLIDVVNDPRYATAVGLMCYGAENERTESASGARNENFLSRGIKFIGDFFRDIT